VAPSVIVFFPLMVALNILTESASRSSASRSAAAGQLGNDHQRRTAALYTRPWVAIGPASAS